MATIVWGAWVANSRWRIGIETYYSPTTITASTASVTVYTNIWFQVQYASSESGQSGTTVKLTSPWASGPTQFSWSLGANGTKKILSTSKSYSLQYGATQKLTMNGSATVAYTYPGTGTASTTLTLPARPLSAPASPTTVTLARAANEALNGSWVNRSTTAAPYTNLEVQWFNSKSSAWYWGSSSVAGSATSYSITGTTDRKYKIRVRAKNSAGYSAWVESAYTSTTPAVPAAPSAAKNDVGDIVVTLPTPAAGSSAVNYDIWHAANGVWDAAKLATVSATSGTWTHAAPNTSQTHAYRIRAVSASPTLTTTDSAASNTVQLQAPPSAPTSLSPNGPTLSSAASLDLSWKHNPTDTTPQKYREVQHRTSTDGGVTWGAWTSTGKVASTSQSLLGVTGWGNGRHEWQVRTWGGATTGGSDTTGGSPWSSSAFFTVADAPQVSISSPDGLNPVAQSIISVTWGYTQTAGSAQTQRKATLYDANGVALQQLSGNDASTSATFGKPVVDGLSYSVGVTAKSSDGLWSTETRQAFTVDFFEPPSGTVHPTYDRATGTTSIDVDVPGPQAADVLVRQNRAVNPSMRAATGTQEIRRNHCPNPQPVGTTGYSAQVAPTIVPAPWDVTRNAAQSVSNATGTFFIFTPPAATTAFAVNDLVRVSATVQIPAGKWYRHSVHVRTGNIYYTTPAWVQSDGNPIRLSATATITAANQDVDMSLLVANDSAGAVLPSGVAILIGDVMYSKFSGSFPNPLPYFDGDSTPADGKTYAWTGAAGATTSVENGVPITGWNGAYQTATSDGGTGFLAENPYTSMQYSGVGYGAVVGDYWAARIFVEPDPDYTYDGSEQLRFTIHDGTGYVSADSVGGVVGGVYLPFSAVKKELVTYSAAALTNTAPRVYLYSNKPFPFRVSKLIMEKVSGTGQAPGVFFDGSSPQDGDFRHKWEGVADASISREFIQQQVDAVSVEVYRSTDLVEWSKVGTAPVGSSLSDPVPPLNTTVYYRAHTISALPSVAIGKDSSVPTDSDRIVFVNAGPGFQDSVRIKHNLSSDEDGGLVNRELHRFAGRRRAVEYSGVEEEHQISIKGTLYGVLQGDDWSEAALALERAKSSSWEEIVAFAKRKGPFILRTSWGVWKYVSPGKPSISGRGEVEQQVTWAFEETDETEVPA